MRKQFCQYCGEPIEAHCDCESVVAREEAEAKDEFIRAYEDSPETQRGWAMQDLIDSRRFEQ